MRARRVEWGIWVALTIVLVVGPPALPVHATPPPDHYSGWAVDAYPEDSAGEMEATVRRMAESGANVVWIGHNNPGVVDPDKVEPVSYTHLRAHET